VSDAVIGPAARVRWATPGPSRGDAQREIIAATERFVAEVARADR
jgi:hypothetical protein